MSMNSLGGLIAQGIENRNVLLGGAALAGLYMFKKSGASSAEKASQKLFESLPADMFAKKGISTAKTFGIVGAVLTGLTSLGLMARVAVMHGKLQDDCKGIWNAIKASWHSSWFGNEDSLNKLIDKKAQASRASRRSSFTSGTGATSDDEIKQLTKDHQIMKDYRKKKEDLEKDHADKNGAALAELSKLEDARKAKTELEAKLKIEKNKTGITDALGDIIKYNNHMIIYKAFNETYKKDNKKVKLSELVEKSTKLSAKGKKMITDDKLELPVSSNECEAKIKDLIQKRNDKVTSIKNLVGADYKDELSKSLDDLGDEHISIDDLRKKQNALPAVYSKWVAEQRKTQIDAAEAKITTSTEEHTKLAEKAEKAKTALKTHTDTEKAEELRAKGLVMIDVQQNNARMAAQAEADRKRIKDLEDRLADASAS